MEELAVEDALAQPHAVDADVHALQLLLVHVFVHLHGYGTAQLVVVGQVVVEVVAAVAQEVACAVQLIVVVGPPPVDEFAVVGILGLYHLIHGVPHLAGAALVHEVAHIDGCAVYELALEVIHLHHAAEQAGVLGVVGPVVAAVVVGVVYPGYCVVAGLGAVESQSEVGVLGYEAPHAALGAGAPHHDVVAGEVLVVVEEVHHHQVEKLAPVYPLLILLEGVSVFAVEGGEGVPVIHVALLQLVPVLYHVDVFQPVVVGVDVVLVAALAYVEHAFVHPVYVDYHGPPCLPVEVGVAGHGALNHGVAHVEIVEVVAGVAQDD